MGIRTEGGVPRGKDADIAVGASYSLLQGRILQNTPETAMVCCCQ